MHGVTRDVQDRLKAAYGAPALRPESGDSFEAAVAAILGQQGGSAKAALAIERLRDNEVRDPRAILAGILDHGERSAERPFPDHRAHSHAFNQAVADDQTFCELGKRRLELGPDGLVYLKA